MLYPTGARLRRPRTPYVVKYLEGIPTPATLLDHLAGANLASGSSTSFFTTVPRYLNYQHDNRLSKLFFHHVLYPAGGARGPTQAVVVRAGRSVVPCRPRRVIATSLAATAADITTTNTNTNTNTMMTTTATAKTKPQVNPLAVPRSQLGAATDTTDATGYSPEQHAYSSTRWGRTDPARRPYFYPPPLSRQAGDSTGFTHTPGVPSVLAAPPLRHERGGEWEGGADDHHSSHGGTPSHDGPSPPTASTGPSSLQRAPGPGADVRRTAPPAPPPPPPDREVTDTALAALRGTVEHALRVGLEPGQTSSTARRAWADRMAALAVNRSLGLLVASPEFEVEGWTPAAAAATTTTTTTSAETTPLGLLRRVCEQHGRRPRHTPEDGWVAPFTAYVQTTLPHDAIAVLPFDTPHNESTGGGGESGEHRGRSGNSNAGVRQAVCRLAGGLEPLLPFAVGTPLRRPAAAAPAAEATDNAASTDPHAMAVRAVRAAAAVPFSHVTCLVRLSGVVPVNAVADAAGEPGLEEESGRSRRIAAPPSAREPWRLGGPALDPVVAYAARTLAESTAGTAHTIATPSPPSRTQQQQLLLGRVDCETYLIPQRELLLTLHVPPPTQRLCEVQNASRVAKQMRLGHAAGQEAGPRGLPLTLSPALQAEWRGAGHTGCRHGRSDNPGGEERGVELGGVRDHDEPDHVSADPGVDLPLTCDRLVRRRLANAQAAMRTGTTAAETPAPTRTYEVRALPGDAVYIPAGWAFAARRIVGTALVDMAAAESASAGPGDATGVYRFSNRSPALTRTPVRASDRVAPRAPGETAGCGGEGQDGGHPVVHEVDVDAFLLSYRPYPILSQEQADVYVSANYVHKGIDEFYEKGGNPLYYRYE